MAEYDKTLIDRPQEKKLDFPENTLLDAADISELEKCMKLDPCNGELAIRLARAYRDCGEKIQAIHWFRNVITEFGIEAAERELMELYLSGIAGPECKAQAEKYFAEEAKEEFSAELLDKMDYLLALEQVYIDSIPTLKPEPVPAKKGFLFTNKKEIERIESENAHKESKKKVLEEKYKTTLGELKAEKKACGIKRKLFYEYPIVMENSYNFYSSLRRGNKGYSLYTFGNDKLQEMHLNNQGYDITGSFVASSYCTGELDFLIFDHAQNRKLVDKDYPSGKQEVLYLAGERGNRTGRVAYIKKLLNDERLMTLYCNRDYLEENSGEIFEVNYLWDMEYRYFASNSNSKSLVENLATYHLCENNLTDLYYNLGEGKKYANIRDVIVQDAKVYKGNHYSAPRFDSHQEWRYKKKALIVWHNGKIVSIFVPRKAADVVVLQGDYTAHPDRENGEGYLFQINAIRREEGVCWDYYVGTTIDHIARKMMKYLPPIDFTEEKPEGLPDHLWRYWFRLRYYFTHKN